VATTKMGVVMLLGFLSTLAPNPHTGNLQGVRCWMGTCEGRKSKYGLGRGREKGGKHRWP